MARTNEVILEERGNFKDTFGAFLDSEGLQTAIRTVTSTMGRQSALTNKSALRKEMVDAVIERLPVFLTDERGPLFATMRAGIIRVIAEHQVGDVVTELKEHISPELYFMLQVKDGMRDFLHRVVTNAMIVGGIAVFLAGSAVQAAAGSSLSTSTFPALAAAALFAIPIAAGTAAAVLVAREMVFFRRHSSRRNSRRVFVQAARGKLLCSCCR